MNESSPDPREAVDGGDPGGLIDGGSAELPGVQDLGPADADADAEANAQDEEAGFAASTDHES